MPSADLVLALVAALKADPALQSMLYTDSAGNLAVYDHELPDIDDFTMPQKLLVVRPHGGPATFRWLQLNDTRITLYAYAQTPSLAHQVYDAAYLRLKNLTPSVWSSTYIQWCNPAAGPIPMRDAHYQWPYNVSSWLVRADDRTPT